MNLLNSFFRVKSTPAPELIFAKTTYGDYSYEVPDRYAGKTIVIEVSGAGGGPYNFLSPMETKPVGVAGDGEKYVYSGHFSSGQVISGLIGRAGRRLTGTNQNYGSGYSNGEDGGIYVNTQQNVRAGGGGGSTSLMFDDELEYEASGGGGLKKDGVTTGGTGGGPNGGTYGNPGGNGGGANGYRYYGGSSVDKSASDGYVKIYVYPS